MLELGKYNELKALRKTSVGVYLGAEGGQEVLLPNKYVPKYLKEGEMLKVFVYKDSQHRLISTTLEPMLTLHQFAMLEVKEITTHGAFLEWGLEKDLFVPYPLQAQALREGNKYLVYLMIDDVTKRLVGTTKVNRVLRSNPITVSVGQEVDLLVWEPIEIGVKVIINQQHQGLVYNNEIFQPISPGDQLKGYIKKIQDDDRIDVSLQQQGYGNVPPNAEKILEMLKKGEGFMPITDKSDPALIQKELEMSKKTFKKAVGALYKQRIIRIESDGIYLNS